jgi:hypothetical protein
METEGTETEWMAGIEGIISEVISVGIGSIWAFFTRIERRTVEAGPSTGNNKVSGEMR